MVKAWPAEPAPEIRASVGASSPGRVGPDEGHQASDLSADMLIRLVSGATRCSLRVR